jgi:hypothetical protein
MAITLDVKMPSIPVGVMKCCMFGDNLNGTFSLHLCMGVTASNAKTEFSDDSRPRYVGLTRQYFAHVHQARLQAEVEPAGSAVAQARDVGEEHARGGLHRKVLAHQPERGGVLQRSNHVLHGDKLLRDLFDQFHPGHLVLGRLLIRFRILHAKT